MTDWIRLRATAARGLSDALLTRLLSDPEVTPESRVILEAEASRRSERVAS